MGHIPVKYVAIKEYLVIQLTSLSQVAGIVIPVGKHVNDRCILKQ